MMYHIAAIILAPGSIIKPGNWGRMLNLYQVGQSDMTNLLREIIMENIRLKEFSEKPSRLSSCFALPSLEAAKFYHTHNYQSGVMYKVKFKEDKPIIHNGDFNLVQPRPGQMWLPAMEEMARSYWNGERSSVRDNTGNLHVDCREIVTPSPLEILEQVHFT